ncbi:MAG: hypothetical protein PHC85_00450 [Candidatus Pacebacteria bacterium]|nr:hypothetical protein [Candidatus Paceibacterota bacterium]
MERYYGKIALAFIIALVGIMGFLLSHSRGPFGLPKEPVMIVDRYVATWGGSVNTRMTVTRQDGKIDSYKVFPSSEWLACRIDYIPFGSYGILVEDAEGRLWFKPAQRTFNVKSWIFAVEVVYDCGGAVKVKLKDGSKIWAYNNFLGNSYVGYRLKEGAVGAVEIEADGVGWFVSNEALEWNLWTSRLS